MNPYSFMATGTYTNAATALPRLIQLSDKPDYFLVRDITNYGAASNATGVIETWTYPNTMSASAYRGTGMVNAAAASNYFYGVTGTSGGFVYVDSSNPPVFASVTGTTINATTFVASTASTTGFAVGDLVRVTTPTGMNQVGGMIFSITAISAGASITFGYMASAIAAGSMTFAAGATACVLRKVMPSLMCPRLKNVAYVTQAALGVVYFTEPHDYTIGEMVDFHIPTSYGMTQLSNLTGKSRGPARVITATNTAAVSSITIDLDTSGFTAFSYPTSAAILTPPVGSPATCFPAGSGIIPVSGSIVTAQPPGINLAAAFDNKNQYGMYLGSSVVGANSAVMQWSAYRA